jgi:hypothetical protein
MLCTPHCRKTYNDAGTAKISARRKRQLTVQVGVCIGKIRTSGRRRGVPFRALPIAPGVADNPLGGFMPRGFYGKDVYDAHITADASPPRGRRYNAYELE